MDYKELVNSGAKWGLLLGVILSASRVYELGVTTAGNEANFTPFVMEWLLVVVLYIYIMFRANKSRRNSLSEETRYGWGDVINYTILISVFASFLVGVATHIYIMNVVGGYDIYVTKSMATVAAALEASNLDPQIVDSVIQQSNLAVESAKESTPTILSAIMSTVTNYILYGFFTAIAIATFVTRKGEVHKVDKNE